MEPSKRAWTRPSPPTNSRAIISRPACRVLRGKLIQVYAEPQAGGIRVLDTLAGQLGTAEGIILIGEVGPEQEGELHDLMQRFGAA